ncbi:Reversal of tor2 lethality [Tulasnella sp. 419]|nr:Reversal of tor2 lethality [Tulasnella sp. 418]KAG8957187.1 Reversal of tor2 lethality [Tulasnella sp. 419]
MLCNFAVIALGALSFLGGSSAQDVMLDQIHNITSLRGTWSSGTGAVQTGPGFANPASYSFEYPKTTGISYSFTTDFLDNGEDGYFEEAQYRFEGNGSKPNCIVGIVLFQHGTYKLNPNGSITLNPFPEDGRIQVQDMCAADSNVMQQFNQTTLFSGWRIFQDPTLGPKLQIYRFDGAPLSPMYLIADPPNMLPTRVLTNVTALQGGGPISASGPRASIPGGSMAIGLVVSIIAMLGGLAVML